MQSPPSFALLVPLNALASEVMRSPFSGDVARSTTTQLPGSPRPLLGLLALEPEPVHALVATAAMAVMAISSAADRHPRPRFHIIGSPAQPAQGQQHTRRGQPRLRRALADRP